MKNFVIYYEPGARGDFLANVIANGNQLSDKKCEVGREISTMYSKIHRYSFGAGWQYYGPNKGSILLKSFDKIFDIVKQDDLISIRIVGNNFSDCADIAYMHKEKNVHQVDSTISDVSAQSVYGIAWRESYDILQRHRFDHVIEFNQLFDIKFIKDFYFEINKQSMPDEHYNNIVENMKKQVRYTETETGRKLLNEIALR
jgi:hypothetical protein